MDLVWEELSAGFGGPAHLARMLIRLGIAVVLGGVIGWERQREHKEAGWRTHMLVALGAALFTLAPTLWGEMKSEAVARIIQGVAAGVGFIGGGSILKLTDQQKVHGLTTAASIWVTAVVGLAAGAGWAAPAIVVAVLAWAVLSLLHWIEHRSGAGRDPGEPSVD